MPFSPNTLDRERDKFKQVNSETVVRVFNEQAFTDKIIVEAPPLYKRERKVSSVVTFIGENYTQGEDLTTATWRVRRIVSGASVIETQYADDGKFTQPFDDPESLFPTLVLFNNYSTDFDGINDVANGGDIFTFDSPNAFSTTFWIKPQNVAAQRCIFSKATNDANVHGYILYHDNTGKLFLQMRAPGKLRQHTFTTTLIAGIWQSVTLTYDGSGDINGVRVYRNTVVGDTPLTGSLGSWLSGQDFTLGARNTAFFFSGRIDEFTVHNKALSQSEITEFYNGGILLNPNVVSSAPFLVSWFRMGDNDLFPVITDNKSTNNLNMLNMTSSDFVLDVP